MKLSRGAAALALALLLFLIPATPVTATPGDGAITVDEALTLKGAISVDAPSLTLFATDGSQVRDLQATAGTAKITAFTLVTRHATFPASTKQSWEETQDYAFDAAALALTGTTSEFRFLAWSDAPLATARYEAADAQVRAVEEKTLVPMLFLRSDLDANAPSSERATFSYIATDQFEATAPAGRGHLEGAIEAFLSGGQIEVAHNGGRDTLAAGKTVTPIVPGAVNEVRETFLFLTLTDASITLDAAGPLHAYAKEPTITVNGEAAATAAEGELRIDGERYPVENEPVSIAGVLEIRPTLQARASSPTSGADPTVDYSERYAPGYRVGVAGDIAAISVDAQAVPIPVGSQSLAVAVTGAALLATGALYFWPLLRYEAAAALIPLYHRLKQPQILSNEVRNGVYAIIKANPGISVRSLHRASGLSWGTVVYHLRQLERHHLVKSTRNGRSRNFYENHGKYMGLEKEIAILNADKSTLLAHAIVTTPGITQEALKERVNLPQSTVSYYIRKLKQAGLIEEQRNGKYSTYFPSSALPPLLLVVNAEGGRPSGQPGTVETAAVEASN